MVVVTATAYFEGGPVIRQDVRSTPKSDTCAVQLASDVCCVGQKRETSAKMNKRKMKTLRASKPPVGSVILSLMNPSS